LQDKKQRVPLQPLSEKRKWDKKRSSDRNWKYWTGKAGQKSGDALKGEKKSR